MISFNEICDAYELVSFDGGNGASAHLNIAEGRMVIVPSPIASDNDEIEEAEKQLETGEWIELPDKYDLGLGKELVFRFAADNLSAMDFGRVERIFSHRGAYANWKDFLAERELLNKWYEFSEAAEVQALRDWLAAAEIPFSDEDQRGALSK